MIHQIGRKVMTLKLSHLSLLTRTTELTKNDKITFIYKGRGIAYLFIYSLLKAFSDQGYIEGRALS